MTARPLHIDPDIEPSAADAERERAARCLLAEAKAGALRAITAAQRIQDRARILSELIKRGDCNASRIGDLPDDLSREEKLAADVAALETSRIQTMRVKLYGPSHG